METPVYEKLLVYKISKDLSDIIWKIVEKWSNFEKDTVGNSLMNTSDSISENIAKATVPGRFENNIRFAKKARSALFETRHWLKKASRQKYITEIEIDELLVLIEKLGPRISDFIKVVSMKSR